MVSDHLPGNSIQVGKSGLWDSIRVTQSDKEDVDNNIIGSGGTDTAYCVGADLCCVLSPELVEQRRVHTVICVASRTDCNIESVLTTSEGVKDGKSVNVNRCPHLGFRARSVHRWTSLTHKRKISLGLFERVAVDGSRVRISYESQPSDPPPGGHQSRAYFRPKGAAAGTL